MLVPFCWDNREPEFIICVEDPELVQCGCRENVPFCEKPGTEKKKLEKRLQETIQDKTITTFWEGLKTCDITRKNIRVTTR